MTTGPRASTAQKKTAPGRISGGGFADRETSGARPKVYTNSESDATVYDGRLLIGYLIDEPKQVAALTPRRLLIGLYPDRKSACHAIFVHHQTDLRAA